MTNNPNAIPANLNVTTASYAAAFGDAIGNALVDDSVFTEGVNAFAENALLTIATGQYLEGVPPGAIPQHTPLQGEPGSDLRLTVNVDNLSTTLPDQVFDASPATNPTLGIQQNTLNTGDTLTDTAGDGTLDFTAVDPAIGLGNPPFALGVTMNGIATANILNLSELDPAGFSGDITGLTTLTVVGGSVDFGVIQVGAPGLGAGLNTALEQINVNTSQFIDAFFEPAALTGAEALDVNLNGVEAFLFLDVTNGTTGYGQIDITSAVDPNEVTITTGFDTVATVTVDGDQDLTVHSGSFPYGGFFDATNVLNVANLDLFDASAATGDITVGEKCVDNAFSNPETGFFGTGDVQVLGGSGDDSFVFFVDGAVDVQGNDGDDAFTFQTDALNDGETTFTDADLADGGGGENRLNLEAYQGDLLTTGVAASILNIQTIEHYTGVSGGGTFGMAGDLDVDMSEAGSATTLDLAGDYYDFGVAVARDVTVTDLTNVDTVIYSGINLGTLTLEHVAPLGIVNFTMAQDLGNTCLDLVFDAPEHILGALDVATGGLVNLDSTGAADTNIITDVSDVDANVIVTGDVDLTLGSDGGEYDFDGGTVDASAFEGDLTEFIGFANTTAIGGQGDDVFGLTISDFFFFGNFSVASTIDLSVGGNDTALFWDVYNNFPSLDINPFFGGPNYHTVEGFEVTGDDADTVALDLSELSFNGADLDTTIGTSVSAGDDLQTFIFTTNTDVNAFNFAYNFIKVDTPVNVGFGVSSQAAFNAAMGATGDIDVGFFGNPDDVLFAFYDSTGQQMVLGVVDGPGGNITSGDDFDVIGLIGMTKAEYDAFNNVSFVA